MSREKDDCFFIYGPWAGRCSNLDARECYYAREILPLTTPMGIDPNPSPTMELAPVTCYVLHPFRTPEKVWNIYAPEGVDDDQILSELVHAYTERENHGRRP